MRGLKFNSNSKILSSILILLVLLYTIFKIAPANIYVVAGFSILTALLSYLITSFFLNRKDSVLITFSILIFLIMNYLTGFSPINVALLIAAVLGIKLLLK